MKTSRKILRYILIVLSIVLFICLSYLVYFVLRLNKELTYDINQERLQHKEAIKNFYFSGKIKKVEFNAKSERYFIDISIDSIFNKPPVLFRTFGYFYSLKGDTILNIIVSEEIYNKVNIGDSIMKKSGEYNILINDTSMQLISNNYTKWLP